MNTTPDMLSAGLQMVAALAVVLLMIYFLLQAIRRFGQNRLGQSGGKAIRVLESHYLGVKKSICLVKVPGKVLILGVCSDRINLLDTVDEAAVEGLVAAAGPESFGSMVADRLKKMTSGRTHKDDK